MPEWLKGPADSAEMLWNVLLLRISLAMGFGLVVAAVYAATQRRPPGQIVPMATTLVLLTMLVAMTTIVIGESVARAFGLVGALSIVRFRTVVDDTRDTSFVIFAVVVGMALGAGNLYVCLIGVPLVSAIVFALSFLNAANGTGERTLEVRVGAGRDPEEILALVFGEQLQNWRLVSVLSARQGAAIDALYRVRLKDPAALFALVKAIQAIEGVQSVDLKRD